MQRHWGWTDSKTRGIGKITGIEVTRQARDKASATQFYLRRNDGSPDAAYELKLQAGRTRGELLGTTVNPQGDSHTRKPVPLMEQVLWAPPVKRTPRSGIAAKQRSRSGVPTLWARRATKSTALLPIHLPGRLHRSHRPRPSDQRRVDVTLDLLNPSGTFSFPRIDGVLFLPGGKELLRSL